MKRIIINAVIVGIALVLVMVLLHFSGVPLFRRSVIDKLEAPVQIRTLRPDGLVTADGRVIRLPYVRLLPVSNLIFAAATTRGVELGPNGTVMGLIDVHHWCGNDPVGKHIGRIDLAALALFLGGEPTEDAPESYREIMSHFPPRSRPRTRIDPGEYQCIQILVFMMESPTNSFTIRSYHP
jgi:hypothetical protein